MATGFSPSYTASSALTDLYKKTNTAVMQAIKTRTEENDWFDDVPDEDIILSANEMRLVLDVNHEVGVAMIPEGGYEAVLSSVAPEHGTFTPVQMNARYSFSLRYQNGWNNKGKAGQIMNQNRYQAMKKAEAIGELIGLQTYGFTTGTIFVVAATGSASATQTNIQLKNAFGTSLIAGTSAAEKEYLSKLLRPGEGVALIRSGNLIEFGTYNGNGTSGAGFADITFTSSITPTADDLIVKANAVTDATISATDVNRWSVGLFDATTSASVHGLATSSAPNWRSIQDSTGGRWSYAKQEKLFNDMANLGGQTPDMVIWSQGVRRDVIAGERAALRYESSAFDFDGKFTTTGVKYNTSRLAPVGTVFAFAKDAYRKRLLSEKPAPDGTPSMFSLDKVQDRNSMAASIDFMYFRAVNNRGAIGVATGLSEQ